ncbi:Kelch-like ECH-associated protein 1, partial [Dissostichus eleginoides]
PHPPRLSAAGPVALSDVRSLGSLEMQHVRIPWCFECEGGEDGRNIYRIASCLLLPAGFKGRDQTFTENKRDVELKTAVVESNKKKR